MDRILLVGCGGFIGAVLRYLVSLGTLRLLGTTLYGTLVVNVVGCLVIGFLGGLAEERQYLGPKSVYSSSSASSAASPLFHPWPTRPRKYCARVRCQPP